MLESTNLVLDQDDAQGPVMYEHIVQAVFNEPWALKPEMYATICDLVRFRAGGGKLTQVEIDSRIGAAHTRRGAARNGAVAVLPLYGILAQRMNLMMNMSGGTSTELFGKAFREAMADRSVGAVVIDIDSPGGDVYGMTELWQIIMDARGDKPIVAVANSLAASAAYLIATAADEIVVTPGGEVGSIGVLVAHEDQSAALEKAGVKVTLISAGKKKVLGNPLEPLSDEAREELQKKVDTYYGMLVDAVARGRAVSASEVRNGFGEGGTVLAKEAVKLGMADRIGTLESTVARLLGSRAGGSRAKAEAPVRDALDLNRRRAGLL